MTDSTKEYDPFAGDSGLLDDFDGTIRDAFFNVDPAFRGQLILNLEMDTDDEEEPEVVNKYGCGPDWASYDDGETAEHPKGPKKRYNMNAAIQKLFAAAIEAGAEEELRRRSREMYEDQGHRHASIWKGLSFHWNIVSEPYDFVDKNGKQVKGTTNRSLPSKFLGVVDLTDGGGPAATTSPAPTASQSAATTSAAPATPTGANGDHDINPEMLAKIKLLAQTQTYAEWVDSVMEIPGALQNTVLVSKLGDETFYAEMKG